MAYDPKPIALTQVDAGDYTGPAPQPFVVVGDIPGGGGGSSITPQEAPVIDPEPADLEAVAAALQDVVDALIAAGVFTE